MYTLLCSFGSFLPSSSFCFACLHLICCFFSWHIAIFFSTSVRCLRLDKWARIHLWVLVCVCIVLWLDWSCTMLCENIAWPVNECADTVNINNKLNRNSWRWSHIGEILHFSCMVKRCRLLLCLSSPLHNQWMLRCKMATMCVCYLNGKQFSSMQNIQSKSINHRSDKLNWMTFMRVCWDSIVFRSSVNDGWNWDASIIFI